MQLSPAAWVSLTAPDKPHAARPWEAVTADLDAALAHGVVDVRLGGGEPTASPDLLKVLRRAQESGLRPVVVTNGIALGSVARLDAVHGAGARRVLVRLHGADAAAHDAVAGAGTFARAVATLRLLAVHPLDAAILFVVTPQTSGDMEAIVALAAEVGVALQLAGCFGPAPVPEAPPGPAVVAALDVAWQAAGARGVPLHADNLAWTPLPQPTTGPLPLLDANLAALFDDAATPPSAVTGVRALPDDGDPTALLAACDTVGRLSQLGPALAAAGSPPRDLPACLGGSEALPTGARTQQPGCASCPRQDRCQGVPSSLHHHVTAGPPSGWQGMPTGARIAVLWPFQHDRLLVASTLPGLVAALRARGADATLLGRWDLPFDPHDLAATVHHGGLARAWSFVYRTITRRPDPLSNYRPPPGMHGHPFRCGVDEAAARVVDEAWWDGLDLSGFDVVIATGFEVARRAHDHPTFRADARLIVADFHMLDGTQAWMDSRNPTGASPGTSQWWPGDRVTVHSCFPRFQALYRAVGVPLAQVHWRPYPVLASHVPTGPEPASCDAIFSGGRHARDFATLQAAAARLRGRVHPIRIHADPAAVTAPELPLQALGMAELPDFVRTIRTSRFVVLPLVHDVTHAAGISVVALALAAGRPVIATATPAMLDHLRDGVDSLLVPAGDAEALARAIERLDNDDALLARLAAGARAAGLRLSVEAWATALLHGAPPVAFHHAPHTDAGTAYSW